MNNNQKYWKKRIENPLPLLPEDERIYLNVEYKEREFAKYCHCRFDAEKKLWFTGCLNSNLDSLIDLYSINENTSEKAIELLNVSLAKQNRI